MHYKWASSVSKSRSVVDLIANPKSVQYHQKYHFLIFLGHDISGHCTVNMSCHGRIVDSHAMLQQKNYAAIVNLYNLSDKLEAVLLILTGIASAEPAWPLYGILVHTITGKLVYVLCQCLAVCQLLRPTEHYLWLDPKTFSYRILPHPFPLISYPTVLFFL